MPKYSKSQLVSVRIRSTQLNSKRDKLCEFTGRIIKAIQLEHDSQYLVEVIRIIKDECGFFKINKEPVIVNESEIEVAEPSSLLLGLI